MKKLVFTVIALFVFGFGSYASNIEEQKFKNIEYSRNIDFAYKETTSNNPWLTFLTNLKNCGEAYQELKQELTPYFGEANANTIATNAWKGCMGIE
jgi:hypothetical protein